MKTFSLYRKKNSQDIGVMILLAVYVPNNKLKLYNVQQNNHSKLYRSAMAGGSSYAIGGSKMSNKPFYTLPFLRPKVKAMK